MKSLFLLLFATTAGFTASAIVANLYRLAGFAGNGQNEKVLRAIVMIVAGPSVLFETAMRGYVAKEWTAAFFWFVAAGLAYWSLALGLLVIDIGTKI